MTTLVVQEWLESERGWGQSFDGYSVHASSADLEEFIKEYWASMPDGPAPDVYSRPTGSPIVFDFIFEEDLVNKVRESKNGFRTYDRIFGE